MPDDTSRQHQHYMRRCIELAERALLTGDAPVGALLVLKGLVIAEGVEAVRARGDVTAHAEIEAVRLACARTGSLDLSNGTLYTSVEPCPMCAYAIRLARVGIVVTGARSSASEPPWSGMGLLASTDLLPHRPPPSIVREVLAGECRAIATRRGA
jgi:tRNA(adenine34) deaminase